MHMLRKARMHLKGKRTASMHTGAFSVRADVQLLAGTGARADARLAGSRRRAALYPASQLALFQRVGEPRPFCLPCSGTKVVDLHEHI
mmetsp:Transcript_130905/g.195042  ORF Transcript_130905/g.195042 Transcript_130905/m.195042 type:complete len:88 (-) Transcript_130905:34-297(-)